MQLQMKNSNVLDKTRERLNERWKAYKMDIDRLNIQNEEQNKMIESLQVEIEKLRNQAMFVSNQFHQQLHYIGS